MLFKCVAIVELAIIIGFSVVFYIFKQRLKKEEENWKLESEAQYKKGKKEAVEVIRLTIEKIQDDKIKLNELNEKELLVEVMMALAGYGKRLDRIEENIKIVNDSKHQLESINAIIEQISGKTTILGDSVTKFENQTTVLDSTSSKLLENVSNVNGHLSNVESINERIETIITDITKNISPLENASSKLDEIMININSTISKYSDSPVEILNKIKEQLMNLAKCIDDIEDSVNDNWNKLCSIHGDVETNGEKIDEVQNNVSNNWALIEQVNSNALEIKSIIDTKLESIESSISNTEEIIERRLSGYYSSNVFDELSSIKSDLSDIERKLDET